jgi:hypothetical protein
MYQAREGADNETQYESHDVTEVDLIVRDAYLKACRSVPFGMICVSPQLCIGAPIILGRWPSLTAHESESMLRTYLVSREKQERQTEKQANGTWEKHTVY